MPCTNPSARTVAGSGGNSTPVTPNLHLRLFDLDYRATEVATDQPLAGVMPVLKRTLAWDYVSRITGITDPNAASNSFGGTTNEL